MNLVIGSCFRTPSQAHVDRYTTQVAALKTLAESRGDRLQVISVWGDSPDDTPQRVASALGAVRLATLTLVDRTHGFGQFGSTTHPDRLAGFAYAANGVFEAIQPDADVVVYIESDLIWTAEDLYAGIDQLTPTQQILSLPTFCQGTDTFYDLWAYRTLAGENFGPLAPYAPGIHPRGLTELGSAGGCLILSGDAARRFRCTPKNALVGLCYQARAAGVKIWTDWSVKVWHP